MWKCMCQRMEENSHTNGHSAAGYIHEAFLGTKIVIYVVFVNPC